MKLEQIKSNDDLFIYIEGILNDYAEFGITDKDDTVKEIVLLCVHCVENFKKKHGIEDIIKSSFEEMEANGELDKIQADCELFEKNKKSIYADIITEAYEICNKEGLIKFVEYCDRFGIVPDEEILKQYR